jgi:hypothetical protein
LAAGQRLYPIYLFARLLINGGVEEVDVPVQARGWSMVVIYLISGSSVALLVANTHGEVSNTAAVARCGRLYVVYVWVTSSPFSVGTRHTPFSILEGFKVMQRYGRMADALPPSPAHNSHRENELRLFMW